MSKYEYPQRLTVVDDRYNGVYNSFMEPKKSPEECKYTAWDLSIDEVPTEIEQDDVTCRNFWLQNKIPCGRGATVEDAVKDLIFQLNKNKNQNKGPYIDESEKRFILDIEGNFVVWQSRKPFTENEMETHISRFENMSNAVINAHTLFENDITSNLNDADYLKLLLSVAVDKWKAGKQSNREKQ